MNIPYVFKKCTKCGEILPATTEYFKKQKGGKYGLGSWCKECFKAYRKQYYEQNKEHDKERNKKYYEANKEHYKEIHKQWSNQNKNRKKETNKQWYEQNKKHILKRQKQYNEQNKEARAEYGRKYREANKEREAERQKQWYKTPQGQILSFNKRSRRRAKEQAQGKGITKEQWLELMSFFNWQCAYSGEYLGGKDNQSIRSLDHIEPINKGGANEIWNVVPMYRPYNSSKNDKDLLEWYTEQPYFSQDRLDKIYEWQEYAFNKWGIDTEAQ